MQYIALIGDIVDSKGQARRGDLQRTLAAELKRISERSKSKLASPYTITLGDEFQAVYKSADNVFLDIFSILAELAPGAEARFGIGVGELTTAINPKQALGMDGPAFHRARDAISILKKSGYLIRLQGNPPPFRADQRSKPGAHEHAGPSSAPDPADLRKAMPVVRTTPEVCEAWMAARRCSRQ